MLRSSLIAAGVAVLCASAATQQTMPKYPVSGTVRDGGTLDWKTGTWQRTGNQLVGANAAGAVTIYNNTCSWTGGAFFAGGFNTCFETYDDGRIPTTDANDPTLATVGVADSYTICGWTFGYCTSETVLQSFVMGFWDGLQTSGVGGQCAGPFGPASSATSAGGLGEFLISGLPRAGTFDVNSCWIITIDLTNAPNTQWCMNGNDDIDWDNDPAQDSFAWSWRLGLASTAPTNPTGMFISGEPSLGGGSGSFDIPFATDPITGGPCGTGDGIGDLFWINTDQPVTCPAPASGCYFFGGYPGNPHGSFYLTLQGIGKGGSGVTTYCTAKPSDRNKCLASLSTLGPDPPVKGNNDFTVVVDNSETNTPGIFFGSFTSQAALPFLGGTLCFFPPLRRGAIMFGGAGGSGGQGPGCMGTYAQTINNGVVITALGGFEAVNAGDTTFMQAWFRAPCMGCNTGFEIGLSNAVQLDWAP
jgi:hypothetical protein